MPADPDCIFCKIVAGELPATIVDQDERTLTFMDINPATKGHMLVIPREHAKNLLEIGADDLDACMRSAQRMARLATDKLACHGVNLLNSCGEAAWQTVFHFHVHVVPRWDDDPLELPWRPRPGDQDAIKAAAEELTT
jgi:histidine triad (HIT) family protein